MPRLLVLITLILYSGPATAAPQVEDQALNSFLARITEAASQVNSFSCKFTQKRRISIFKREITFSGILAVQRPDRLRWQVLSPLPSVMLLDGSRGRQCQGEQEPRLFDTASDPVMGIVARQLWSWLSGDYPRLRDSYKIGLAGPETIRLEPIDPGMTAIVSAITVRFSPQSLQPEMVLISESSGDQTTLNFSGYRLRQRFGEDYFSNCSPSDPHGP